MSAGERLIRLAIALANAPHKYNPIPHTPTHNLNTMDILVQKPNFCHSSSEYYEPPPSSYYTPYNTPPYIAQNGPGSWLPEQQLPQMQYLRFPTPPITPPRASAPAAVEYGLSPRTQSVIMKCTKQSSTSGSGSPTESCSEQSSCSDCDFLCNWHDCGR